VAAFISNINLGIPEIPAGVPDELVPTITGIYGALRALQQALGDATGGNYIDTTNALQLLPSMAQSFQVGNLQVLLLTAVNAINAGDFITLVLSGGVTKADQAKGNALATRTWGWAPQAVAAGNVGVFVMLSGYHPGYGALTLAATYYLSPSALGGITSVKPSTSGNIIQEVGVAISATELLVRISTPILIP
jgi:hypothetical protein